MDHKQVKALRSYVSRSLLPSGTGAKARAAMLHLCSAEANNSGCQSVHSICLGGGKRAEQQQFLARCRQLRAARRCCSLNAMLPQYVSARR